MLGQLHLWLGATLRHISGRSELATDVCPLWLPMLGPALSQSRRWTLGFDVGSQGADNSSSLVETCRFNSSDLEIYLRHVIDDHPVNPVDDLLPLNVRNRLASKTLLPV